VKYLLTLFDYHGSTFEINLENLNHIEIINVNKMMVVNITSTNRNKGTFPLITKIDINLLP